ncbi:nucleotide pyrophosphohydrolase [Candidatus Woesearchaeota archaeon]|nr:nucleotide pyrophosphohydrolase [Candidatus Woesearchaeota archaeon]
MKEKFQELYESLKLDRKNSEWSREHSMEDRLKELQSEVDEIKKALENDDIENLKDELGDALLDLIFMIVIAEEQGLFNGKEVIDNTVTKIKRRKPWIFNGEKVSKEEENRRWNETKKLEKVK